MCELCAISFIAEAIVWLFVAISLMCSGSEILYFLSLYLLLGLFMVVIEGIFGLTRFFYGPYFHFEVGIFIFLYPLIFIETIISYFVGEEVVSECPYCGELVWDSILKRGVRYGKCKKCGKEFIIKDKPILIRRTYEVQKQR